jgi:hypothetical protein
MRIWDIPPEKLCQSHLLGEHSEQHAIWSVLTQNKKGFSHHPETIRWKGKLRALYLRHQEVVKEMRKRGMKHNSPMDKSLAKGFDYQDEYVDSIDRQKKILKGKGCKCDI